ncbi:MAG TPA: hypothetical protein DDX54_00055 [Rhodospirillaceae bacterium]|nr:hypothetical protein [Rhodospirillaceae bacterium]
MVRGGVYDELRAEMAQEFLMSSLDVIESYKSRNGHYPESLEVLAETLPADSMQRLSLTDPTLVGGAQMLLYYERVGESEYRLLARGPDGEPFTQDDITLPGPFRGYGLTN